MMYELLLSLVTLINSADFNLHRAILLSREHKHQESEQVLSTIDAYKAKNPDTYHFYRLLNNFCANKKDAKKYADILEESFTSQNLPTRYQVLTALMINEMKQWKDNDLADVARDMKHVKNRLANMDGGKNVQKTQKDIEDKLKRLIEQMENKAKGSGSAKNDKQQQKEKAGNDPSKPMKDSQIVKEGGSGKADKRNWRISKEQWGRMTPREQASAVQEIIRTMPPRFRESIENYFRNLSRTKR